MYSIDFLGNITRDSDGAIIPADANNIDYHNYMAWVDEGNTPRSYTPPVANPKEQAKAELAASDKDMARIAEDLINIMVNNGLIKKEDLPNPVIAKLDNCANLRKVLQADDD